MPTRFINYSREDGLSSVSVNCLYKDSHGFLWIGTQDGLNRFDGIAFKTFSNKPKDSSSICGNDVQSVVEDRDHKVWVGTKNDGLCYYDYHTGTFHIPVFGKQYEKMLRIITIIETGKSNSVFVGTKSFGVFEIDIHTGQIIRHVLPKVNSSITAIYQGAAGELYIGTETEGLFRIDNASETRMLKNILQNVSAIAADRNGKIWVASPSLGVVAIDNYMNNIATPMGIGAQCLAFDVNNNAWVGSGSSGILVYNKVGNQIAHFTTPVSGGKYSLPSMQITAIVSDFTGAIYIGTFSGLSIYDLSEFYLKVEAPNSGKGSPNSSFINAIIQLPDDNIMLGYIDNGIDVYDRKTGQYTNYKNTAKNTTALVDNKVFTFFKDSRDMVWVGTMSGLMQYDLTTKRFITSTNSSNPILKELANIWVLCFTEDKKGDLWIGTRGQGIYIYNRETNKTTHLIKNAEAKNEIPGNTIHSLYTDLSGAVWIGTDINGVCKFNPVQNSFTCFSNDPANSASLGSNEILCITGDSKGSVWIGTGKGLYTYSDKSGSFKNCSDKLPNQTVYGILLDKSDNLYVSTFAGVGIYNVEADRFDFISRNERINNAEFNQGAFYRDKNGVFYFGSVTLGLLSFHPDSIKKSLSGYPLSLVSFKKFYKEQELGADPILRKHFDLSYRDYVITFEFALLDLKYAQNVRYAFMLEGLDTKWYVTGKQRFITYTNLAPGDYKLRVRVSMDGATWADAGEAITISISPPFYQTWWFRLLGILLVLGFISGAYILRINFLKRSQQRELEEQRLRSELDTARKIQMNLLNVKLPDSPFFEMSAHCEPAFEVGGDFYDVFWHDQDHTVLGIALIDISGKAMQASIDSFITAGILVNMRKVGFDTTAEALTIMNRSLFEKKSDRRQYAAFCFALVDLRTKILDLTNAGQPEVMLLRRNEVINLHSELPRMPVGRKGKIEYINTQHQLETNDILVFFSDAFPETPNGENNPFGYERITQTLLANNNKGLTEISSALFDALNNFSGSAMQYDDASLILLRIL